MATDGEPTTLVLKRLAAREHSEASPLRQWSVRIHEKRPARDLDEPRGASAASSSGLGGRMASGSGLGAGVAGAAAPEDEDELARARLVEVIAALRAGAAQSKDPKEDHDYFGDGGAAKDHDYFDDGGADVDHDSFDTGGAEAEGMKEELRNLTACGAFERIGPAALQKLGVERRAVIPGKWVKQPRPGGTVRCQVVATEVRHGPKDADLYAPTPSTSTLRVVPRHGSVFMQTFAGPWSLRGADVSAAFLNVDVDGVVVVRPPPGARGSDDELWLVKKAFLRLGRSPKLRAEKVRAE